MPPDSIRNENFEQFVADVRNKNTSGAFALNDEAKQLVSDIRTAQLDGTDNSEQILMASSRISKINSGILGFQKNHLEKLKDINLQNRDGTRRISDLWTGLFGSREKKQDLKDRKRARVLNKQKFQENKVALLSFYELKEIRRKLVASALLEKENKIEQKNFFKKLLGGRKDKINVRGLYGEKGGILRGALRILPKIIIPLLAAFALGFLDRLRFLINSAKFLGGLTKGLGPISVALANGIIKYIRVAFTTITGGDLPKLLAKMGDGKVIQRAIASIRKNFGGVGKLFGGIARFFGKLTAGKLTGTINKLIGYFTKMLPFVGKLGIIGKVIPGINAVFAIFEVITGIFRGVKLGSEMDNVGGLVSGFTGAIGGILEFLTFGLLDFNSFFKDVAPNVQGIFDSIKSGDMSGVIEGLWGAIKGIVLNLGGAVLNMFTGIIEFIGGLAWDGVAGAIKDIGKQLFGSILNVLIETDWMTVIGKVLTTSGNILKGLGTVFLDLITGWFGFLKKFLGAIAADVGRGIYNAMAGFINSIIGWLQSVARDSLPFGLGNSVANKLDRFKLGINTEPSRFKALIDEFRDYGRGINNTEVANRIEAGSMLALPGIGGGITVIDNSNNVVQGGASTVVTTADTTDSAFASEANGMWVTR